MNDDKFKPDNLYQKLINATNMTGGQMFSDHPEADIKINLRPDKSVPLGKFKPDPFNSRGYIAHPTTIRAMRKEIFVAGEELFVDLEHEIDCHSCGKKIDQQFWIFCPFCEASLQNN